MDVLYFEKTVTLKQKIRLKSDKEVTVKGTYEYESCNEEQCIFPPASPFEFKLTGTPDCLKSNSGSVTPEKKNDLNSNNPCACDSLALERIWHNIQNNGGTTSISPNANAVATAAKTENKTTVN